MPEMTDSAMIITSTLQAKVWPTLITCGQVLRFHNASQPEMTLTVLSQHSQQLCQTCLHRAVDQVDLKKQKQISYMREPL